MKEKDKQIDAVNFDMSNALRELDTLESKYKQTRVELAAAIQARKKGQDLEHDYDELLVHYEKTSAQLESAEADIKYLRGKVSNSELERGQLLEQIKRQQTEISSLRDGIQQHVKSLKTTEEHRDLFQSRLKEAVDDLEELENERNELRCDLDKTYSESAKLESS
jgi:chromosome segregation ATPase